MAGSGFVAIVAALLAAQAGAEEQDCTLTYSAGPAINEVIRDRGFDFETYDPLCAAARRHGLVVTITGHSGVQSERAFGWASVTVRRAATGAVSTREELSTYMDLSATAPVATDLLYLAVNAAANELIDGMDEHIRAIEVEEARLRAAFAAEARGSPQR